MSFTQLSIPTDASFAYQSDSFGSFQITSPTMWSYPGVSNQSGVIGPNKQVTMYLLDSSFVLLPLTNNQQSLGANVDLCFGFYDVTSGPAVWVGPVLPFVSPYGTAANGIAMSATTNGLQPMRAVRQFGIDTPVTFGGTTSSQSGKIYQIGPAFQFHTSSSSYYQYEFHVHYAWKAV